MIDWTRDYAAIFKPNRGLCVVKDIDFVDINSLVGLNSQKDQLIKNTRDFLDNKDANHALLWGEMGCGKSSLIKAIFTKFYTDGLRLIELFYDDLRYISDIIDELRNSEFKFIIFCDDLSFENGSRDYKFLKPLMQGSIEKPPRNVLIYATSNRRHLVSELKSDNLGTEILDGEIHYGDSVQEKISLSDRFGLWISFYQGNFSEYLQIVDFYFKDINVNKELLHEAAKTYATLRGSRSGRTARQFFMTYKDRIK